MRPNRFRSLSSVAVLWWGQAFPSELAVLPAYEKGLKIISAEPAPWHATHMPTGQVILEFTVDLLGLRIRAKDVEIH